MSVSLRSPASRRSWLRSLGGRHSGRLGPGRLIKLVFREAGRSRDPVGRGGGRRGPIPIFGDGCSTTAGSHRHRLRGARRRRRRSRRSASAREAAADGDAGSSRSLASWGACARNPRRSCRPVRLWIGGCTCSTAVRRRRLAPLSGPRRPPARPEQFGRNIEALLGVAASVAARRRIASPAARRELYFPSPPPPSISGPRDRARRSAFLLLLSAARRPGARWL